MKKIICLLISALIMSCSQVNMPVTQESRSTPKPIQTQTIGANNQTKVSVDNKPEIKAPTTPTITPVPSTNFIQVIPTSTPVPIPSGISPPIVIVTGSLPPTIKYHNPDTIIEPVPEGSSELLLSLYFKDIYRIRYNKEKNEFYSLSGYDTSSINKILIANSIEITISSSYTEEYMDKMEKERQEVETGDVPHYGSIYYIRKSELISNVEFVDMVRAHPYVRSFNYYNVSPISG